MEIIHVPCRYIHISTKELSRQRVEEYQNTSIIFKIYKKMRIIRFPTSFLRKSLTCSSKLKHVHVYTI